jgi:hypothetical protein
MMKRRDGKFNNVPIFHFVAQGTLIVVDVALSLISVLAARL